MADSCFRCDRTLDPGDKFCSACGAPRDATGLDASQKMTEERIALLCRYLPNALVKSLMVERRAPVGQRSVAAVVFADVSGFTAMSERMDPEDVLKVMNGCFEGLVEAVDKYGGLVDKFIGDCLMAIFGVPTAHEDDATRAVMACFEMFDYLEEYNKTLTKPLGLSVGVNFGPLVAGNLGASGRMDYTVLGNTVNLSQRLEAAANGGQILVSDPVRKAAEADIEFNPLDPIRVKGIAEPVIIFEAVRPREEKSSRPQLPLIGRNNYLTGLETAIYDTNNKSLAIDIFGDEGVGKSRLAEQISERWVAGGGERMATAIAAPGFGLVRPYGGVGALVESICNIEPGDPPNRRLKKLTKLSEIGVDGGWQTFLEYVVEKSGAKMGAIDGEAIRTGLIGALNNLFEKLSKKRWLITLDDYDKYDRQSIDIFRGLWSDSAPDGLRVILIRSQESAPLYERSDTVKYAEIKPLDPAATLGLIAARLSIKEIPPGPAKFFHEQSGGNPRFLLELIESLLETGLIYPGGDGFLIRDDLGSEAGGLNLAGLVRSRIDRLPVDQRYLLQAAALYGPSFPADIICEAVGEQRSGPKWLAELTQRGMLAKTSGQFSFAHALLQQAAIDGLLKDQRAKLNTLLGAAIEATGGTSPENLPLLARFFSEGEDKDKAVFYLERAGDYFYDAGQFLRAADIYEKLSRLDQSSDAVARALINCANCFELGGEDERAQAAYVRAEQMAASSGSASRSSVAQRGIARLYRKAGSITEAAGYIERAISSGREGEDPKSEGWALLESAEIELARQNMEAARNNLEAAQNISTELKETDREGSLRGRCLGRLGRLALGGGDTAGALPLLEQAASICDGAGDERELVRLYGNLGVLHHRSSREGAQTYFNRAISMAKKIGDRAGEAKQLHNLGAYLSETGDRSEALACYEASYDLARALGWVEGIAVNSAAIKQLRA